MGPVGSLASRRTGRQTVGRNVNWNGTFVIALQITDPSSRQRGRPTWKIKKVIVAQINVTSGHLLQKGQDTKMNWPTVVMWLHGLSSDSCYLFLSNRAHSKLSVSLPSHEDWSSSSFWIFVASSYLEFRTMDKVREPCDSKLRLAYVKHKLCI
jgi:hypothetical protein